MSMSRAEYDELTPEETDVLLDRVNTLVKGQVDLLVALAQLISMGRARG